MTTTGGESEQTGSKVTAAFGLAVGPTVDEQVINTHFNTEIDDYVCNQPLMTGARLGIELGCGRHKHSPDIVGVDRLPMTNEDAEVVPDILADLEVTPWVWADTGCAAFVIAHQTLEHISNLIPVMQEIHRIADDDSWVEIIVPHYKSEAAHQDPTHVRHFTPRTFRYFEPGFVSLFSDYGIRDYFAIAAQGWREDGNIWTVLRPLKTPDDCEAFQTWYHTPEIQRHEFAIAAPAWITDRCDEHRFLGGAEEPPPAT